MAEVPRSIQAGISIVSTLVIMQCIDSSIQPPKIKTKAKARYLKRKKLRRKARKSSAPRRPDDAPEASSASEKEEDGVMDVGGNNRSAKVTTMEQPVPPPKKKRRVNEGPDMDDCSTGEMRNSESRKYPSIQRSLVEPTGTMHPFPSPTIPNVPPQSVLAMQGVDKALIHAEIIDPAAVTPLSTAEQDHDIGLSSKTRRRLLDLGISELFPGQG